MKKTVVCMLIAAMTMGSIVTPVFADGEGDATHIYVLTAPEDHGWTGSVATFAKEKIEEVKDVKYVDKQMGYMFYIVLNDNRRVLLSLIESTNNE